MRTQQPTITIQYRQGGFFYGRSDERLVNQMIAIRQALRNCFQEQAHTVGCFSWFSSRKKIRPLINDAPNEPLFYDEASDQAIIQKALTTILLNGLYDIRMIRLCIELTKHPDYQKAEYAFQTQIHQENVGLLSYCSNRQSVVRCFVAVFHHYGYRLTLPSNSPAKKKRKKIKQIKSPMSYEEIYIRTCR